MQTLQERPSKQFLEKIFSRVQRIKKDERKELLQKRDKRGHTALYMAALLQKDLPVLARYIADSYVELNLSPNEVIINFLIKIIDERLNNPDFIRCILRVVQICFSLHPKYAPYLKNMIIIL